MTDKYDALEKLQSLLEKGTITEEEFKKEKEKLLNNDAKPKPLPIVSKDLFGLEENTYTMLIHIAATLVLVDFTLAAIAAFLLWIFYKDKNINVDNHGRIVFNWLLTLLLASFVLVFVYFLFFRNFMDSIFYWGMFYAFFPLLLLLLVSLIQAIIGAVKANSGALWHYPLSIPFIKPRK